MSVTKSQIGVLPDGGVVERYTLKNANGAEASFTNLGAIWLTMLVPDQKGELRDVVLGFDTVEGILADPGHMGAPVGRYANRISDAAFELNGKRYQLAVNSGPNHIHSGPDFYRTRLWEAEYDNSGLGSYVMFSLVSPDGDQGFPGEAHISITYTLSDDNALEINYKLACETDTVANFTNHAYFNLEGHDAGDISDQLVWINAARFTPADENSVPTGEFRAVEGTPMDFTEGRRIGDDIDADYEQLKLAGGYDHNWCLDEFDGDVRLVARAYAPDSGISMEVYTDLEGLQFYTANGMKDVIPGKNGAHYGRRAGYCFETQHYPNAVNQPAFVSPVVKAGEGLETTTIYQFGLGE